MKEKIVCSQKIMGLVIRISKSTEWNRWLMSPDQGRKIVIGIMKRVPIARQTLAVQFSTRL